MKKGLPFRPARSCRKITGPGLVTRTAMAAAKRIGAVSAKPIEAPTISKVRFTMRRVLPVLARRRGTSGRHPM
jgi:hypothetical protein